MTGIYHGYTYPERTEKIQRNIQAMNTLKQYYPTTWLNILRDALNHCKYVSEVTAYLAEAIAEAEAEEEEHREILDRINGPNY